MWGIWVEIQKNVWNQGGNAANQGGNLIIAIEISQIMTQKSNGNDKFKE